MADPVSLVPRTAGPLTPDRVRALPLAPVDGFILSQIDGSLSAGDLAELTGVPIDGVLASLRKLEKLGVVALGDAPPPPKPRARSSQAPKPVPAREPPPPPRDGPPPQVERPRPAPSSRDDAPRHDARVPPPTPPAAPPAAPPPAAATEAPAGESFAPLPDVDLEPDHQREIHSYWSRLAELDHYAILSVDRASEKKAIKRAYFERTARFHPDRFFRKRLGPFKTRMEEVFGRMTEAHDTLTNAARRAEYDAYLASVQKTRSIEAEVAEASAEARRRATLPPPTPSTVFTPPPSPLELPPPPPAPREAQPTRSREQEERARRELLARRLTAANAPRKAPAPAPPPDDPTAATKKKDDAVDALKRRYQEKVALAKAAQVKKYATAAAEARAKGDWVAAATAFRVALSVDEGDPELQRATEDAQRHADKILLGQYLTQAEYEERSERWADAARSWKRVAGARENDAVSCERAAHCLLRADGDLHEAAALGQKAVQLAPKDARARVTLANVYLAAGLAKNARRELEAAAQLAPGDETIQALLKRATKPA